MYEQLSLEKYSHDLHAGFLRNIVQWKNIRGPGHHVCEQVQLKAGDVENAHVDAYAGAGKTSYEEHEAIVKE